jgi:two-component system invasion response regulator UvrY
MDGCIDFPMIKKATTTINVLIADDHAILREGVKHICHATKDITIVAATDNGLDAIKLCRSKPVQVLILDILLPDRSGIDVLKQAKKEFPQLAVLILSTYKEDQYAVRCLKAGADGFLNKHVSPAELVDAIRQIASGRKYIGPTLAQVLANHIGTPENTLPHASLSDREYQTLVMIASGKTVGDIAVELLLSVKTISMYRARILSKMKLRHNAELTHYAIKNHLVD